MPGGEFNCSSTNEAVCKQDECRGDSSSLIWAALYCLVIAKGLVSNTTLLTLLYRSKNRKVHVLGINAALINLLFLCTSMPLEIFSRLSQSENTIQKVSDGFGVLNLFGSPMLLASMCVERYVAVALPVLYLRLNDRPYRAGWAVLVWVLTLATAVLATSLGLREFLPVLVGITGAFFLLMLASLLGIVWALCRRAPGDNRETMCAVKKRALLNVLAVFVPAVLTYVPSMMTFTMVTVTNLSCSMFFLVLGFLTFGVFIAPTFYLSRMRQFTLFACCKKG